MKKTLNRRAKIQALADDARGDAAIRALAQRWLDRHPAPPPQQQVSGIRPSEEYLRYRRGLRVAPKK
jgi:hypothetical protein